MRVSCAFAPGTLTAIVGPNGAGKTTYFNLISGPAQGQRGQVHAGRAGPDGAQSPSARTRAGLGRAFQLTNLFPNLSCWRTCAWPCRPRSAGRTAGG
jgi:branched-chain amino acid transport system ATP-binding protein